MTAPQPATVGELCAGLAGTKVPADAASIEVSAVADDSREVAPGALFVAVPGTDDDGRGHASDAVARGAVAVLSESPLDVGVPVIIVPDARAALAHVAAASLGRPADRLRLVGITGTVGKTTVMTLLGEILRASDIPAGTIGSLGVHYPDDDTGDDGAGDDGAGDDSAGDATSLNTTPGALKLQQTLAEMVASGTRVVAMEVTSHAIVQQRVRGLEYDLGVFTNVAMLEHMEYHGSFRDYVDAKSQFLSLLARDAPLVYAAGDRVVRNIARLHPGPRISVGGGGALVTVRRYEQGVDGTHITLNVGKPLPLLDGGRIGPLRLPLELRTLGRAGIMNASLAAVTALCLGARPNAIHRALARLQPPRRRMQLLRRSGPTIIDDTVGHPDSITAVFEVAQMLQYRELRVAFVIRGQRGEEINVRDAEAIAIWSRHVRIDRLVVSAASEQSDERNAVTDRERSAFLSVLEHAGLVFTYHDSLEDTITETLDGVQSEDLVLLLGAQGMDAGAEIVDRLLPPDAHAPQADGTA
jgi:UDP-N-acetylmuramoyl-L-alanyl-D-glutamate--2,6-diaminopimelate ligase